MPRPAILSWTAPALLPQKRAWPLVGAIPLPSSRWPSRLPRLVEKLFLVDDQSADQVIDDGPTVGPFLCIKPKVGRPGKRIELYGHLLLIGFIQRGHDTEPIELVLLRATVCAFSH